MIFRYLLTSFSSELANQAAIDGSRLTVQGSKMKDIENSEVTSPINSINPTNSINSATQSGCIVNVVVVHPSPDQREGILRASFTYTGYEPPADDITLFVSKYSPMGTFENNGANWMWVSEKGLWNIIDDELNCIAKPYPSGHKAMYYGNKSACNYDTGEQNVGYLEMPFIKVESSDAKVRFRYYREVEYNPLRNADEFRVTVLDNKGPTVLWAKDSTQPSENAWTLSPELPLGNWVGKEVRIKFWFDTKDGLDNNHAGVAIDNVEIIGAKWSPWAETSGEVILNWTGGLPKYFVYRGTSPDFTNKLPELRAYTPFNSKYENSLNDYESYYYKIR